MNTAICKLTGCEFPLFAFSHCRDVVVAVSKAGGFGVLGAVMFTPEQLKVELDWIDAHIDGKPYGVDLAIPENMAIKSAQGLSSTDLWAQIPPQHITFFEGLLRKHGIDPTTQTESQQDHAVGLLHDTAHAAMMIAFEHPIALMVQALGLPPQSMIDQGRKHNVPIGALVGSADHAVRQVEFGVDLVVAQGTEAGGHCGDISTIVLVPEVIRRLKDEGHANIPVLAAGGIVTGSQMAAAMTMGAAGAWTGTLWLPTIESELADVMRDKYVAAKSRDTVRSRASSGKLARQLRSAWTEAWAAEDSPDMLPMPFQPLLAEEMRERAIKAAQNGNEQAKQLLNYYVGQGVGMLNDTPSVRHVMQTFMTDYVAALEHAKNLLEA
jgi:NAD(P)H-dependent flavin oxidoreductase YrpB (nitropropane dioxygenase family)